MDPIKEAFNNVKREISVLQNEFLDMKKELSEIQNSLLILSKSLAELVKITASTHKEKKETAKQHIPTQITSSTHPSTDNLHFKAIKSHNINGSIGNDGVPTDRQTDRQTDNPTDNSAKIQHNSINPLTNSPVAKQINTTLVLEQLDAIKKELRFKVKRLTNQELLVLSSIYQFEDRGEIVDYSLLSKNLNLSESSIRDYIQRIIAKGIAINKEKINNKRIVLHMAPELKKLASLNTLLNLRNI